MLKVRSRDATREGRNLASGAEVVLFSDCYDVNFSPTVVNTPALCSRQQGGK